MAYDPPPGAQQPGRYGSVGPNYQKYGEQTQNGYVYYAPQDKYYADPNYAKKYAKEHGYATKEPGLGATVLPLAAAGGALALGKGLGENPSGFIGGLTEGASKIGNTVSGLFGLGTPTNLPGATIATASPSVAQGAGIGQQGLGMLGLQDVGSSTGALDALGAGAGPTNEMASILGATPPVEAPGMFSLSGIGAGGNVILPAAGALGAYNLLTNDVSPARGALQGAASGAAIGSYAGPPGAVVGGVAGGLIGLGKSLFGQHETTKEAQQKNWGDLVKRGLVPQDVASGWLNSDGSAETRSEQDILNAAKSDGKQIWGTYGMYDTFGSDWLGKYSEAQREAISRQIANEGIINSKKGDWFITDKPRAKEIAAEVVSGKKPEPKSPSASQVLDSTVVLPTNPTPQARPGAR